jgi:hypothetical protein
LLHWLSLRDKWLLLGELIAHLIWKLAGLLLWKLASWWEIVLLLNSRCYVLEDVSWDSLRHPFLLYFPLLPNGFP